MTDKWLVTKSGSLLHKPMVLGGKVVTSCLPHTELSPEATNARSRPNRICAKCDPSVTSVPSRSAW